MSYFGNWDGPPGSTCMSWVNNGLCDRVEVVDKKAFHQKFSNKTQQEALDWAADVTKSNALNYGIGILAFGAFVLCAASFLTIYINIKDWQNSRKQRNYIQLDGMCSDQGSSGSAANTTRQTKESGAICPTTCGLFGGMVGVGFIVLGSEVLENCYRHQGS